MLYFPILNISTFVPNIVFGFLYFFMEGLPILYKFQLPQNMDWMLILWFVHNCKQATGFFLDTLEIWILWIDGLWNICHICYSYQNKHFRKIQLKYKVTNRGEVPQSETAFWQFWLYECYIVFFFQYLAIKSWKKKLVIIYLM